MSEPRAAYVVSRAPRRYVGGRSGSRRSAAAAGFPGCKAVPMTAAQLARMEDGPRFEYWDAEEDVAWTVREPAIVHENPAHRLPALLERIAQARGAAIACGGTMTFHERAPTGELVRAMEADQTLYLDEARARALPVPTLALGPDAPSNALPDVVVEVDHATDVRRRKLAEYQRWRFPEVWVEVPEPWQGHRSRREPGLTIHLLEASGSSRYREAPASRALPGWTAEEIHRGLNEPKRSASTSAALERVGRALGRQEGLAPEEDPHLRRLLARARTAGRQDAKAAAVQAVLEQRGIPFSSDLLANPQLAAQPTDASIAAALACASEADFLARLRRRANNRERERDRETAP